MKTKSGRYFDGENDRFDRVYSQGTMNVTEIWVDRETGVNYVFHAAANAGGMLLVRRARRWNRERV
jgi:hypothetical protein